MSGTEEIMIKPIKKKGSVFFFDNRSRGLTCEPTNKFGVSKIHFWVKIGLKVIDSVRIIGHQESNTVRAETNYCRHIKKSQCKGFQLEKKTIENRISET